MVKNPCIIGTDELDARFIHYSLSLAKSVAVVMSKHCSHVQVVCFYVLLHAVNPTFLLTSFTLDWMNSTWRC